MLRNKKRIMKGTGKKSYIIGFPVVIVFSCWGYNVVIEINTRVVIIVTILTTKTKNIMASG